MSQTNGVNGHSKETSGLSWQVGLLNYKSKQYLTFETFGKVINISAKTLKKKNIWTLEKDLQEENVVYLKCTKTESPYITVDKQGNVTLTEEKDNNTKFMVEYGSDGQWLFRNVANGGVLGATGDLNQVKCSKTGKAGVTGKVSKQDILEDEDMWTVQLCIHPQVNILNVNRKRYAHLNNDELQCTEVIPWGADALIILEFVEGNYAFKTSDNRYLTCEGTLSYDRTPDCLYMLEIRSVISKETGKEITGLAFKDSQQRYLTAVGSTATMKGRNKNLSKDELFAIEDSHPQVVFYSDVGKMVSIKQGQDISANQTGEETDKETFQIENIEEHKWAVRTCEGTYWTMDTSGVALQAKGKQCKDGSSFDLQWQDDGSVGILASNKKYVSHVSTGALKASAEKLDAVEKFKVKIINRPLLILKCQHGFVALKSSSSREFVCNKTDKYDIIFLEGTDKGTYSMKDADGKYWRMTDDSYIHSDGTEPTFFTIEFHRQSLIAIKAPNGRYLKGEQNGNFRATGETVDTDTLWEF